LEEAVHKWRSETILGTYPADLSSLLTLTSFIPSYILEQMEKGAVSNYPFSSKYRHQQWNCMRLHSIACPSNCSTDIRVGPTTVPLVRIEIGDPDGRTTEAQLSPPSSEDHVKRLRNSHSLPLFQDAEAMLSENPLYLMMARKFKSGKEERGERRKCHENHESEKEEVSKPIKPVPPLQRRRSSYAPIQFLPNEDGTMPRKVGFAKGVLWA